jgi:ubiquinone/menaquinone biosynthesis C-methylase UbiE
MKLNWAERWVVNNYLRVLQQQLQIGRLRQMSDLPRGARILEVGCGRGAGAQLVDRAFRPSLLCASDLDEQMVQRAKRYLSLRHRGRIRLHVADAENLPIKDESMDAVFGFGVLHHVPDWRCALSEIARVLKSGGSFFVEELYPSLYQNPVTRRILLHPTADRFFSDDLKEAMRAVRLPIKKAIEFKKLGILGVAVKEGLSVPLGDG